MWMILFLLLPLAALAYIGWHVWVLLPLSGLWKSTLLALMVGSFLLLFVNFTGSLDTLPLPLARPLYVVGTSSLFVLLYAFILFLLLDLGRLVRLVPRTLLYNNAWTDLVLTTLLVGVFLYGHLNYRHKVRVPLTLHSQKPLPRPYTVVMASDLHLGYHNTRAELRRWIDFINAEHPDFVLIAGDIIDISVRPLIDEDMAAEFRRLQAPVYACLGNHEYYANEPRARQFYADARIHLLCDQSVEIDSTLVIIGRDDRTNPRRRRVADLVATIDPHKYSILLDHQPYHLEKTEQAAIDFQLSGHTHRGQVWPISWITDAIYECSWGSHQRGHTQYYVSSGLGIWGGMFRIGTQSEYVVATIQ